MLNRIIDEIKRSLENECFIAALALALTLPDICGKAEYPNSGVTERYIKWYNDNIALYQKPDSPYSNDMPYTSGELVYNLRNSLLHQGNPGIDKEKIKEERCSVDKFILTVNDFYDGGISCVSYGKEMKIVNRELEVNIVNLCFQIVRTAEGYYKDNKEKFNFFNYELCDEHKEDCVYWSD